MFAVSKSKQIRQQSALLFLSNNNNPPIMSTSASNIVSEKNLFLGPRIPKHAKKLHRLLRNFDRNYFRLLLHLAIQDLEDKKVDFAENYSDLRTATHTYAIFDLIYGSVRYILKCALMFPTPSLKPEVFRDDLRELKIRDEFIEDLSNVVFGERKSVPGEEINFMIPRLRKLENLSWRVDVSISTSSLNRVLEPNLVMELKFKNGEKKVLEVSPTQFHKLRYAVSTMLKDMEHLEMRKF